MGITSITTEFAGQVGVLPQIVRIATTDSLETITTAGYLNAAAREGYNILNGAIAFIQYATATGAFTAAVSNGVITLSQSSALISGTPGDVITIGSGGDDFADSGAAPSDPTKTVFAMVNSTTTAGHVASFSDTAGTVTDSGIVANRVLVAGFATPDVDANVVAFSVTCGQAALASGGAVALITSSGSKQYRLISLQLNLGGTNFSGNSGDRLGQVTDGTTVYSVIPAADLQTLVNAQWGATALPNPAAAAIDTPTAAGANLSFKYSGGSLDYSAGSVVISGYAVRIA